MEDSGGIFSVSIYLIIIFMCTFSHVHLEGPGSVNQ